ncbi:MAG: glycerol-3-phosphate dehydrogenase [Alphaproteobacteria bacterium]|nr:glycerol-3-phosphate dehydrogenase [Alphaproteobacteria bacterium]
MHTEGTGAPTRHVIPWTEPEYTDPAAIDAEMHRQFDVCHGCRRCFNLCDSFPRLFDLIDNSKTGELDSVDSKDFASVVDACTLCDMCFMTKCPYVPPHPFNIDFPHLMLRYRVMENAQGKVPLLAKEIRKTDRNGWLATLVAPLANWATDVRNRLTRTVLALVANIHPRAWVPKYMTRGQMLVKRAAREPAPVNSAAPAAGRRKVVLYASCSGNYNRPDVGLATRAVLARNGVETVVLHPACCGMPQLEIGDLVSVSASAKKVAAELAPWIDKGYDVVALTPSCALMLKFEWSLIVPKDPNVVRLAKATRDVAEYIVEIARKDGLAEGLAPMQGSVALHISCHSRAQNMGAKAADMLRLIPDAKLTVLDRCSGHGGAWGMEKPHFPVALKVGKPVFRRVIDLAPDHVASECPLAGDHIVQGVQELDKDSKLDRSVHPILLFARAYGIEIGASR